MSDKNEPTFADQLQALETKVRDLETGKLDLDAALKAFEDGIALTRDLNKRLDATEGRIEQLLANGETAPVEKE